MAQMFNLSRATIRKRLKERGISPEKTLDSINVYDMEKAGPAIFFKPNY